MRLLLDTHIALWTATEDRRLSGRARELLNDPANQAWISPVSLWEIAIKHRLGRKGQGAMQVSADKALQDFEEAGFRIAPVTAAHALAVERLPPVHGDPFDRLLVAQAVAEPFRLVTHDTRLTAYGATVILV